MLETIANKVFTEFGLLGALLIGSLSVNAWLLSKYVEACNARLADSKERNGILTEMVKDSIKADVNVATALNGVRDVVSTAIGLGLRSKT